LEGKKFVTAINCMDGRVQLPVIQWMKHKYKADFVDMITEPGPDKILCEKGFELDCQSIRKKVEISVKVHGSKIVAIVGHYDCAGNPTDKDTQIKQIKESIEKIRSWGFNAETIGLWVDENWEVSKIF